LGTSTWPQRTALNLNQGLKVIGEPLKAFATAIEHLSQSALPVLHLDHVCREAGEVFFDGIREQSMKRKLLMEGERTVNCQRDSQKDPRDGGRKASSRVSRQSPKIEFQDILGENPPPQTERRDSRQLTY
jgi:hypothetical protein